MCPFTDTVSLRYLHSNILRTNAAGSRLRIPRNMTLLYGRGVPLDNIHFNITDRQKTEIARDSKIMVIKRYCLEMSACRIRA